MANKTGTTPSVEQNYAAVCYAILRSALVPVHEPTIPKYVRMFDNSVHNVAFLCNEAWEQAEVHKRVNAFFDTLDPDVYQQLTFNYYFVNQDKKLVTTLCWVINE